MPDLNNKKNKHMSFDDRLTIQEGLTQGLSFKAIATNIGKDQITVSKEVCKHITITIPPLCWYDGTGKPITASKIPERGQNIC